MCSIKTLAYIFLLFTISTRTDAVRRLSKSSTTSTITSARNAGSSSSGSSSEKLISDDEPYSFVPNQEDKPNIKNNVYPVYPSYSSSSSYNGGLSSNYYPNYNLDGSYYNSYKYPLRSFDSAYYAPRQGKYNPSPLDYLDGPSLAPGPFPQSSEYVALEAPLDSIFMASSHGGGGGGGSHGHGSSHGNGWGWGKGKGHHTKTITNYKVSAVNTDAIGLLGLLGLLSILQAVLLSLTTTAAGRKRRDVNRPDPEMEKVNHVSQLVLPSFNVIAYAQLKRIPMNCTHHEVCKANNILVNEVGGIGVDVAEKITEGIATMLDKAKDKTSREIILAGKFGRPPLNNCQDIYPICKELGKDGVYSIPLLLSKSHPFYYDHIELAKKQRIK